MTLRLKAGNKAKLPVANAADGLVTQCKQLQLPVPEREFRFHPTRRWRFDLAFTAPYWLAVEVDGGGFVAGRHGRGLGIERDAEKFAEALCHGWRVLRVTPQQIRDGKAIEWIKFLLEINL